MQQDQSGVPAWAKGAVAIIGALTALVLSLAAAGVIGGNDTVREVRASLPGVQADANNNMSRAEQGEAGARPVSVAPEAPSLANSGPDIHEDTRDETPPGITRREADDALIEAPGIQDPRPPVGAQNYHCTPHYVVNQSPLSGARSGVALHFTVSPPGSLQAIWRLFNTPSFGASSNYGIELDGECEIWVAITRKGWAQGAFNSAYISIEIVTNDLSRAQWLAAEIIRDGILASLVADLLRQVGAPPRLVDPVGCSPLAGVTDHNRLECGNTHWDVGNNFPWDVFMRQVRAAYTGLDPVCDKACRAKKRQRAVVTGRDRKHRATHDRMRELGCRRRIHSRPPDAFRRDECRQLKRRDVRQRAGERRARRKLARL